MTGGRNNSTQSISDLISLRQFPTVMAYLRFSILHGSQYTLGLCISSSLVWISRNHSCLIMLTFTLSTEILTSKELKEAIKNCIFTNQSKAALEIGGDRCQEWGQISKPGLTSTLIKHYTQGQASFKGGALLSLSKSVRMILQSFVLGLGAFLALRQEISPGMMIAGSLLLGRALAPIDMLTGSWKGFTVARAQYNRLSELLEQIPAEQETMSLPAPTGRLEAEQIVVSAPGSKNQILRGVSFDLSAGEALGIVGPSGAGKSTLARTLLGIWAPSHGTVRLDGADVSSWDRKELGPHIGYLPQDIELFDGSIAENICRFGPTNAESIVSAATLAGVHELILTLPEGYDTVMSAGGGTLSGGQRQRIGLARAVYNAPRLIVLDEPNSNLDDVGEKELVAAISRIKTQGSTIIVISHRTPLLHAMDKMLVLKEGLVAAFGTKDQVLGQLVGPSAVPKSVAGS